jgi:hypothetical protein
MSNRRHCGDHTAIAATLFAREIHEEERKHQEIMRALATAAPLIGFTLVPVLLAFFG